MAVPALTIGILREQALHAALKDFLAEPGDLIEQKLGGYHIDIQRGEQLIEIQTGNFGAFRNKLGKLLDEHRILVVFPIAETKWIVKQKKNGKEISRRKSPKRGRVEDLFDELMRIPHLVTHPNFSLRVLLTRQEEIWRDDGKGSWRRGHWSIADRRLVEVVHAVQFNGPMDYLRLIPDALEAPFTHKELAKATKMPVWMSTRMSYCLRKMGCLENVGKNGNTLLLAPKIAADTIRPT
jgi:hypothetical protein